MNVDPQRITLRCQNGHPMVRRINRESGEGFYGCSAYPDCRETQPVPAYIRMIEAGATPLPGLEDI